ncbi:MAG TPA: hypothetical protein VN609_05370 [Propionibacteriaceae bacterium]|nr:hypothetical protein [Propionibacteriaceae bacterium]
MTEKPAFDPERNKAIRQMLVREAANEIPPIRNRTARAAAIISLIVAAALLATGSAAWALTAGPLSNLATSPIPSPTATPTQGPGFSAPRSTVPLDCAALASTSSIAVLVPDPKLYPTLRSGTPQRAALLQGGVLSCFWGGTTTTSLLSLDAATDSKAGRASILAQRTNGAASLGVGDDSAVTCQKIILGCRGSVVAGPYWVSFDYEGPADSYSSAPDRMAQLVRRMVAQLQQHPIPLSGWIMPSTSWVPIVGCPGLATSTPMATILSSPGMTGPNAVKPGSENGILQTQAELYNCRWSVPDDAVTPDGQIRSLDVQLAPGAGWAFENEAAGGTAVTVTGAEEARMMCQSAEGDQCWLNVRTDNSWMQLGFSDAITPAQSHLLVTAAEAVIAAHH